MDVYGLAYAALVAFGGLMGYMKAGSTMSLVAGFSFGGLTGFAAYTANDQMMLIASALLGGIMGMRFYGSGKVMPAGLVCFLSLLIVARSIYRLCF